MGGKEGVLQAFAALQGAVSKLGPGEWLEVLAYDFDPMFDLADRKAYEQRPMVFGGQAIDHSEALYLCLAFLDRLDMGLDLDALG